MHSHCRWVELAILLVEHGMGKTRHGSTLGFLCNLARGTIMALRSKKTEEK